MRITRPEPEPRDDDGDYNAWTNGIAYGKPYGSIKLDEAGALRLDRITLDDARRLAKAAVQIEQDLTAAHARMAAPHGTDHVYQGTCQLCGKPDDDELHAEPAPGRDEPCSADAAEALIDAIVAGAPVTVTDDEHPWDAGEGSRELAGPGRELLREAIAEQDAADEAAAVSR